MMAPNRHKLNKWPRALLCAVCLLLAASLLAAQAVIPKGTPRAQSAGQSTRLDISASILPQAEPTPQTTGRPQETPSAPGTSEQPFQETLEASVIEADPPGPCESEESTTGATDPGADPGSGAGQEEPQRCQRVELLVTSGSLKGERVVVDEGRIPVASRSTIVYKAGDRVLVDYLHDTGEGAAFFITDFVRTGQLYVLALIFVGLAVAFGGLRGLSSLLGLVISFAVLLSFMLPRIIAGDDPVLISIVGGFGIMLVTLYLSHGFNLKTTAALCGTTFSLIVTGLLAWISIDFIKLTGFGSDEAVYVQLSQGGAINVRGLLLGGMIIGALGVLDDVTISQSAAVFELRRVDPSLPWQSLFSHAIRIGKDHIAATVNTLVLAYAGASLPLLVLFVASTEGWDQIINQEVVAEEIVRTLVGSIGLIASVPVTTWLASLIAARAPVTPSRQDEKVHVHHH